MAEYSYQNQYLKMSNRLRARNNRNIPVTSSKPKEPDKEYLEFLRKYEELTKGDKKYD